MTKVERFFKKNAKSMEVPLFGGWIHVFYDRELYSQAKKLCNLDVEDYEWFGGVCEHVASPDQGSMILMGIFDLEADICVHECVHAMQFVLEYVGSNCVETEAYLCQKIFCHVFNHMPKGE